MFRPRARPRWIEHTSIFTLILKKEPGMKKICAVLFGLMILGLAPTVSAETQVDALIEKLVEKGVLTRNEGLALKAEIAADEEMVSEERLKDQLPKWVQNTEIKGDVRLRYQYDKKDSNDHGRNRGRVRARVGVISQLTDEVEAGIGIASGSSSDARSTNQTFDNTFSSKDLWLDYAYAKWAWTPWLEVVGGKFIRKDVLWQPTDLLWDGDINPEGASLLFNHELTENIDGWFNVGFWILEDNGNSSETDPFLNSYQAGASMKEGMFDAKLAGTYYQFHNIQGGALTGAAGTNTAGPGGGLLYDYDSVQGSAEVGVSNLFGGLPMSIDERIAVFADVVNNLDGNAEEDLGWALGTKFGNKKVKTKGQWQVKYIYADLEKDAFVDAFPDSDRFDGDTGIDGHEIAFEYAIKDNLIFGLDYYNIDVKNSSNSQDLFQADLVFKF